MSIVNGRQLAPTVAGIRDDHVARYAWATGQIGAGPVIDLGCGCGYGSAMLATIGPVAAYDADAEAIAYAVEHYDDPRITWRNVAAERARFGAAEAAVAFEIIEHVAEPQRLLERLGRKTARLFGSVPNENVIPFAAARNPYHVRHYTPAELGELLAKAGWGEFEIFTQAGKRGAEAEIVPGANGRTLVFRAGR